VVSTEDLVQRVDAAEADMWQWLETLVNLDSPSADGALTQRVADQLARYAAECGLTVEMVPQPEPYADCVVARWTPGPDVPPSELAPPVLLIGHMDTVFGPDETRRRPFRLDLERDRAYGPGVYDMKGGLVIGLTAVRSVLEQHGEAWRTPITFIMNPDEEPGSPVSRELINAEAPGHGLSLILEPGRGTAESPTFTVRRKGVGILRVDVKGVEAHAGQEPELGVNSIVDIAHRILAIDAIQDFAAGTTVTAGVVRGGTHPYVVAGAAQLQIDARVPSQAEQDRVLRELRRIVDATWVPGADATLSGGFHRPPMVPDDRTLRIAETIARFSTELGYPLGIGDSGGASDGNLTAALGVPTIDGLGAQGGRAHSADEYAVASSIAAKCRLVARTLAWWNDGGVIRTPSGEAVVEVS
jgi:glutamate carboxypeptidase